MSILSYLRRLPLREFRLAKAWFRRRYATVEWPEDVPHVTVPDGQDVIDGTLREAHFEGAQGWSLRYDGEVLNLRRPAGVGSNGMKLEDHLRCRRVDGRLQCNAHREPSRWEEKEAHVNEEGLVWHSVAQLTNLFESAGISRDLVVPEPTPKISTDG